ncbi:MAG: cohesin domain-containing protein [Candidatus Methanomethylicia archaeon]
MVAQARFKHILMLVILSQLILTAYLCTVEATGSVEVYIEPQSIETQAGETFTILVKINPGSYGISAGDVNVTFNSQVFDLIDVKIGELFGPDPLIGFQMIDKLRGFVNYAVARKGETKAPSDPGTFLALTFKVRDDVNEVVCEIVISKVGLADQNFQDIKDIAVQHTKVIIIKEKTMYSVTTSITPYTVTLTVTSISATTAILTQTVTVTTTNIKTVPISASDHILLFIFVFLVIIFFSIILGVIIRKAWKKSKI